MRSRTAIVAWALILFFSGMMLGGAAGAQRPDEARTITVVGSAVLTGGNIPAAREAAIAGGLKQAVAAVAVEIASPEGAAQHFKRLSELLLDRSEEYIQGFRVLSEAPSGKQHRVLIQATVAAGRIRESLAGAGALQATPAAAAVPVELTVEGSGNLANFVKLRRALGSLPGVRGVQVKEMKPNEATLMVDYAGGGSELAAALALHPFDTFEVAVVEALENALRVALNPK
ncbi:MAG: hypothetical protein MUC46_04890 [Desulfobacterales bacterium]|nr:hypothetical protein [Desulfobacterales bacterium]